MRVVVVPVSEQEWVGLSGVQRCSPSGTVRNNGGSEQACHAGHERGYRRERGNPNCGAALAGLLTLRVCVPASIRFTTVWGDIHAEVGSPTNLENA